MKTLQAIEQSWSSYGFHQQQSFGRARQQNGGVRKLALY